MGEMMCLRAGAMTVLRSTGTTGSGGGGRPKAMGREHEPRPWWG